jgi:hypothetical protein
MAFSCYAVRMVILTWLILLVGVVVGALSGVEGIGNGHPR